METQELEKYFGAADFAVFFASLVSSGLIGVYFGYKDKNKKSVDSYYFGDRNVSPWRLSPGRPFAPRSMEEVLSCISCLSLAGRRYYRLQESVAGNDKFCYDVAQLSMCEETMKAKWKIVVFTCGDKRATVERIFWTVQQEMGHCLRTGTEGAIGRLGHTNLIKVAVAMSMAVSFISAITVLGYPVETYFYGIAFLWVVVSSIVATIFAMIYFIPLIFRLRMTSMYQFLELRYSSVIRRLCSFIFLIDLSLYMGNTVYLPALALNSVTPLDLEWSIGLTSLVCTFYTTLGGIKAVIWTDVLQSFIMFFGALALFVKATVDVGGFENVMETASQGERFNFFNFDPDIRMRSNAVAYLIGFFMLNANGSWFSQVYAQRYLSCKSVRAARKAAVIRVIPAAVFMILAALDGLAMYAYYEGCDPYKAGYIKRKDQLTPRFAVEVFRTLPGLAGLFVAAAYSGTLSTVSSGINSLSAIATEDFIVPHWPQMTESRRALAAKICTVFFGCVVTAVAYLVSRIKATVVQISMTLSGMFLGPTFAAYLLGTMCPWINEKGAFGGIILGSAFAAWCSFGRIFNGIATEFEETLPTSIEECYSNFTSVTATYEVFNMTIAVQSTEYRSPLVNTLYSINPFLYAFFGFIVGSVFMFVISGITGFNKPSELNPKLFIPLIDNKKVFPERVVKFFRFGVPELAEEEQQEEMLPLQDDVTPIKV